MLAQRNVGPLVADTKLLGGIAQKPNAGLGDANIRGRGELLADGGGGERG
jgi:hypothetical protein